MNPDSISTLRTLLKKNIAQAPETPPDLQPCSLGREVRIVRGRMPGMDSIHEYFSQLLAKTFTDYMCCVIHVHQTAVEFLKFKNLQEAIPTPSMMVVFRLSPLRGSALMIFETKLVYALIDLLCGGKGQSHTPSYKKQVTALEIRIISKVLQRALEDLAMAWQKNMTVQAQFERLELIPQFASIAPNHEIVMVTTFDITINQVPMTMRIGLPQKMLEPIREKLDSPYQMFDTEKQKLHQSYLAKNLEQTAVEVIALLGEARISLKRFLALKQGDFLPLSQNVKEPLQVLVGNQPKFKGFQGSYKGNYAIKVAERIAPPKVD